MSGHEETTRSPELVLGAHPSVGERRHVGQLGREMAPRASAAEWVPAAERPDPAAVIDAQNADRVPALVPTRHARMLVSPFTFYRGAAAIMAADLAGTPTSGITVQLCGDAHLSNFGLFASPERSLVFDINDFDETLPGPWEWDVKRLATSFVVAGRDRGFDEKTTRELARRSVTAYGRAMSDFAAMPTLEVWYSRLRARDITSLTTRSKGKKRVKAAMTKARRRDSAHALSKLAVEVGGEYRIAADPPWVTPLRDALDIMDADDAARVVQEAFDAYAATLSDARRTLLSRFRLVDVAHKAVGVGSLGTRCFVALLEGRDRSDPLFLQAKESTRSVLEDHLPPSAYLQHGERVVKGQLLIQSASDIFLGWATGRRGRDFYFRQLRDMKGSADVERMDPRSMSLYADLCGWTLARAHARSGDPVAVAAYLGTDDAYPRAVAEFARTYADQNDRDYEQVTQAVLDGRLQSAH